MKFLFQVDSTDFVLSVEQAESIMTIIQEAEVYEEKHNWSEKTCTYHVYSQDQLTPFRMKMIPEKLYAVAKLVGKPEER
jgi:hypothetical protein